MSKSCAETALNTALTTVQYSVDWVTDLED
jgi:hypothetical protein